MGSTPSGISGSRAAAIVGASRFRTPVDVWLDIMEERQSGFCEARGYKRDEFSGNASTRWGLGFEAAVIQLAEIAQGERIVDCERFFTFRSSDTGCLSVGLSSAPKHLEKLRTATLIGTKIEAPPYPLITCHLDGVYSESQRIHEGKTTTIHTLRDDWGEPGTDQIPRDYAIQVQHQMLVSGLRSAVVSVLAFPTRPDEWEAAGLRIDQATHLITRGPAVPFDECAADINAEVVDSATGWARVLRDMGFFRQYVIERDDALGAALLDTYRDFWSVNVLGEQPPTPTRYDDVRKLFPSPTGTVVADEELERNAAEYKQITAEASAMAKRKDQLKTAMIARMMASAERPIDEDSGGKVILRGPTGRKLGSFDGKVWR